jgi:hypothetical protein
MIYKLQAPFQSGMAGKMRITDGVGLTDNKKLVDELIDPQGPHGFSLIEEIDELAVAQKVEDAKTGAGTSAETGADSDSKTTGLSVKEQKKAAKAAKAASTAVK